MIVTVQRCNDGIRSSNFGYAFWHKGKVVERCDKSDYHKTVTELTEQGYIIC